MKTAKPAKTADAPKKLTGKGRQGDFVHNTQRMGSSEGFKNVSASWLQTGCMGYDEVMRRIEQGHAAIEDFHVPFKAMQPAIDDDNNFVMRHEGRNFKPTPFAFRQIAAQAGASVFDVEMLAGLREDSNGVNRNRPEDRHALLTLLSTGFSLIDTNKVFLFRTQTDGTLRAWLSKSYKIMDNVWFVDILRSIIPGGRWSHWRDDGDYSTLWGNVLIPDTVRQEQDSDYGAMFSVGNSEIGRRQLHARPSLFRAICMNGCIWDQTRGETFKQVHRGEIDLMVLRGQLRKHLHDQIPLITGAIDDLLATREIVWDGAAARPVFAALGHHFRLGRQTNTDIIDAWRIEANQSETADLKHTGFAVINAVTRSGQQQQDPVTWVQRDELGGRLLRWKKDEWESLFIRAKSMKGPEVAESFVN